MTTNRNNRRDVELPPLLTAESRLIPPTMMDWASGPPPSRWRLPIDEELTRLVRRTRAPAIRSDSAIVAEFPSLTWDGPYRAVRYVLFDLYRKSEGMDSHIALLRKILKQTEAHIVLLSDVSESIRTYIGDEHKSWLILLARSPASQWTEWWSATKSLQAAVTNVERLKQLTEDALRELKKNGRPPNRSKSLFVERLADLWRIMTGDDASRDLAAPFASFVSAAWASLSKDLPEMSWASQIRRRKDTSSAEQLVYWFDERRELAILRLSSREN